MIPTWKVEVLETARFTAQITHTENFIDSSASVNMLARSTN